MTFVSQIETRTARKDHQCTWCGQAINKKSVYKIWTSMDDSVFHNKMHLECVEACNETCRLYGDDEYTPYSNDRPNNGTDSQPS